MVINLVLKRNLKNKINKSKRESGESGTHIDIT